MRCCWTVFRCTLSKAQWFRPWDYIHDNVFHRQIPNENSHVLLSSYSIQAKLTTSNFYVSNLLALSFCSRLYRQLSMIHSSKSPFRQTADHYDIYSASLTDPLCLQKCLTKEVMLYYFIDLLLWIIQEIHLPYRFLYAFCVFDLLFSKGFLGSSMLHFILFPHESLCRFFRSLYCYFL